MRNKMWRAHDHPRLFWAKLTLWLGALSLTPLLGIVAATGAALAGATGAFLQRNRPARYGGRPLLLTGLALAAVGSLAFLGESALFFRWKIRQAEAQRMALSQSRLMAWAGALENYRMDQGFYPETRGLVLLKDSLVPAYTPELSIVDGWERPFILESNAFDYTIRFTPPPGTADSKESPIEVHAYFPVTHPPPPPEVGPPAPWPPQGLVRSEVSGVK